MWLPFCLPDPYLSVPVTRCWTLICRLLPRCTSKGNLKMTDLRLRWCKNDFFSAPRFLTVILMNESVTECGSKQHPAVIWCSCYEILTSFIHQCQLTDFMRLINTSVSRGLHGRNVCVKLRRICEHIKCEIMTLKAALLNLSPVVFFTILLA